MDENRTLITMLNELYKIRLERHKLEIRLVQLNGADIGLAAAATALTPTREIAFDNGVVARFSTGELGASVLFLEPEHN